MEKYKHIFDYFNADGEYIGGCEAILLTKDRPEIKDHKIETYPCYVVYLGWSVDIETKYTGRCLFDNTLRDPVTKQIIRVKREKENPRRPNFEDACLIIGVLPCESYLKRKEEREKSFMEEYTKVVNNPGYFKRKYYGRV